MDELKPESLINLFRCMWLIRACEESFVEPLLAGEIRCPVHLYTGQEAIAAGVCSQLRKNDYVFGTHRSHGHFLAKGGGLKELVSEIYCRESGCSRGRGGSMHLVDSNVGFLGSAPIVGGTISLALGAALSAQIRRNDNVAIAFIGDGAAGEGVLYEVLNFASLKKLPLIIVCENNSYSTHMPIKDIRPSDTIFETAGPFGVLTSCSDGNDISNVYAVARNAIEYCREGNGPAFIEFSTYRMRGHVGPDDNVQGTRTDIRPVEEIEAWKQRDPIYSLQKYLLAKGYVCIEEIDLLKAEICNEVAVAHSEARKALKPSLSDVQKYVFKTTTS